MTKCKHCKRRIDKDMEGDLIHIHLEYKGVDARMCEPNNPDSKIAEPSEGETNAQTNKE